jgi:hypothetical protein
MESSHGGTASERRMAMESPHGDAASKGWPTESSHGNTASVQRILRHFSHGDKASVQRIVSLMATSKAANAYSSERVFNDSVKVNR